MGMDQKNVVPVLLTMMAWLSGLVLAGVPRIR